MFIGFLKNQEPFMAENTDDINMELSKILAKTMQSSYRKKEIHEIMSRIIEKLDEIIRKDIDDTKLRQLRKEFEELRREYYGLSES